MFPIYLYLFIIFSMSFYSFIHSLKRQNNREKDQERERVHICINFVSWYSPSNGCNSQVCARLKPGAKTSSWSPTWAAEIAFHHLPRCTGRKLCWKQNSQDSSHHCDMECWHHSTNLTHCTVLLVPVFSILIKETNQTSGDYLLLTKGLSEMLHGLNHFFLFTSFSYIG